MKTSRLILRTALAAGISTAAMAADFPVSDFAGLAAAVADAGDGDTITLAAGTYDVTAKLTVEKGVKIAGAGKGQTILDGGATASPARSTAVFYVKAAGVKISGLTFQNASDVADNAPVYVSSSNGGMSGFEISDCEFVNCHGKRAGALATSDGASVGSGGIEERAAYPIITGCGFTACGSHGDNTVSQGGAVCGSFWVENSTFDSCTRQAWSVVMLHSSSVVSNCVFSNMGLAALPTSTGIICMSQSGGRAHLLVEDCVFAGIGEGPLVGEACSVIDRCVVSNCYGTAKAKYDALVAGGDAIDAINAVNGISTRPWVNPQSSPECRNTLFIGNKLPIQLFGSDTYVNCTFVDNAGGVFCKADSMTPLLENCVFWGNAEWTCDGARITQGGYGIAFHYSGLPAGVQIANCVFQHVSENPGLMAVANVDATGVSSNLSCRADAEGIKFADYANGDFRPDDGSVLNAHGVVLEWMYDATDLAGHARLYNGKVDIGCYQGEFGASDGPVDPAGPLPEGYKPSISGFDNGSGGIKITIDNALAGRLYGYRKSTTLEGLKDAQVVPMDSPAASAGELLFTIARDPNEPTCFYQIVVE
ncbi:MAG: hypothetical protein IJI73_07075 [Kiritimatiellae bacterium]|nr:hypothetical protein [Kiritimatiellia bacterium]